ncbi:DUF6443 domain-containing protein [Flectobacillus major]|uniref:DUF6443 domain-containing protein n=1 Tax=Flectobacillus major TaxID=103 RepID=UPI00040913A2|nr:peptidoglycan DD-metalloendopeptidase family protein [Flectobacillus major]
MKPLLLAILLLCVTFSSIYAQKAKADSVNIPKDTVTNVVTANGILDLVPQLTPKSPNVAALGRYAEYPVSMFTGLPSIEIPIFTIDVNGISVPIKLSYHASGHKVTDVASFVGLGWALQFSGSITRQAKGLPDEINAGLLGKNIPIDIQASLGASCYNQDVQFTYQQMAENNIDTERDIFSVNIPNKSNQFILRNLTDYQWLNPEVSKIKFTKSTNNSNSFFELTDESGTQYLFDEPEVTNGIGISAWLLKKIQGVRPQDKILFEYYAGSSYTRTHDIMEALTINDNGTGSVPSGVPMFTPSSSPPIPDLISINNAVEQKLPRFIYFPMGKIEFVLETNDRQDGLGKALDKIKVYAYNVSTQTYLLSKSYDLVYLYRNRQDNTPVLFLDEVRMLDNTDTEIGKYQFSYHTAVALPSVQSKSKDFWGYYNGINNTTLIPAQNIPMVYQNAYPNTGTLAIGGGNRESREDFMKAWIIARIAYPTGGYTDFEFEANRYFDGTAQQKVGGLRIKKITNMASTTAIPVIKSYKYGQGENGNGRLRESLSLQYETKQKVIYYNTTVSGQPSSPLYTYDTRRYTSNLTGPLFPNEGSPVTYTYVTEYEDAGSANNGKTLYQFRDDTDTKITLNRGAKFFVNSKHWNRGQLLSKQVYGKDNLLKYSQFNTYLVMASGNTPDFCGRLLQLQNIYQNFRPNYAQGASICYYNTDDATPAQTYFFGYGTTKLVKSEEFFYDNQDANKFTQKTSYTDYDPNFLLPRLSRTIVNAGEIRGKKFFYPFDYGTIPTSKTGELLAIRRMQEKNQLNIPIEEVSYRKNSISDNDSLVSGAKLTSFYSFEDASVSKYTLPASIYLLESQQFNILGANPYQSSASRFVANPNAYSSALPKHELYEQKVAMDSYDTQGNLTSYSISNGGRTDAFAYQQFTHDGVLLSLLTSQTQDNGGLNHQTFFTYTTPLLGVASIKAPNETFTYFEYDSFGRLKTIKDHNTNVLKEYAYSFPNRNITEWLPRTALTVVNANTPTTQALKTVSYVDGLGRELQKVLANASPDASKDIIATSLVYDAYGRPHKSFLATPSTLANGSFLADVLTPAKAFYDNDNNPFNETTLFDESPLNRPLTSFGPGSAWRTANKAINTQYNVAPANTIKRFKASLSAVFCNVEGQPSTIDYYGPNELQKKVTTSEQGKQTIEYIDLQGRTIQKEVEADNAEKLTTAYVYDLYDRLTYVVPPQAYKLFSTNKTYLLDNETASLEGLYAYKYDRKGQLIQKHIPGHSTFEQIIYDRQYRKVMSADAQDDALGYWQYIKYDKLNRPVMSGLIFLPTGTTRATIQSSFDTQTIVSEVRSSNTPSGYLNNSFPSTYNPSGDTTAAGTNIKTITFYDNHTFLPSNHYNFDATNAYHSQWSEKKGLMTGSVVRNLETNDWYKSVNYYDEKGRVIQTFNQNHLGGIDRTDFQYRFNGEILATRLTQKKPGANDLVELYEYSYDHVGRKTAFSHNSKVVAKYQYDEIGRLKTKTFAPAGSAQYSTKTGEWNDKEIWQSGNLPLANDNVTINQGHIVTIPDGQMATAAILNTIGTLKNFGTLAMGQNQSIDLYTQSYKYHIRGGLKGINLDANNNLTNSLFSYKLTYEEDGTYYDGNIRNQYWKSNIDGIQRAFQYTYDGASRITAAAYGSTKAGENYALNNVNYDANGNITNLSRNGWKNNNTFGLIDNLNYTYNTNSNKILKVDDISGETASFSDVSGNDYTYWQDGSLKSDNNKGISLIEYNYLKLPKKVVQNGVATLYQYDATGKKLKETIGSDITDYSANKIYKNNTLYQISHDEGRIVNGEYEYNITDHLGNLRVAFKDSLGIAKITQANAYGVWGEDLPTLSYQNTSNLNNFKFTGKESLQGTGYTDFGARWYDNIVPHFITQDPMAEVMFSQSSYNYCFNNPISFFDSDGMVPLPMIIRFSQRGRGISTNSWNPAHNKFRAHKGIDLKTGGVTGLSVSAAANGIVDKIGWDKKGWGRYVIIRHENGYFSLYAHLEKNGVQVRVGDQLSNGQSFARSGNTGGSTGPHLHLEFRRKQNENDSFKKSEILNPYEIDDLQVLIDDEDRKNIDIDAGFIKARDISFGNNSLPSFKLPPIIKISTNFTTGGDFNVNSVPYKNYIQEKKKNSESSPITGAHD